ncbi:MAG: hypothetical protein R3335_10710 [Anaerolineales bacterium]|nr:hypothetical protein [Anaerolineales bacterium]
MNNNRFFQISTLAVLIVALAVSACQPVQVATTGVEAEPANVQPQSLDSSDEAGSREAPPDGTSLQDRPATYSRSLPGGRSVALLDQATRDLVLEITQFSDDHLAEMGESYQPAPNTTVRYKDDHWAEMAAILGGENTSPDSTVRFADDHWEEMVEIHQ